LADSREIARFEEVAKMRALKKVQEAASDSDDEILIDKVVRKSIDDDKPYLSVEQAGGGDVRISILLPPFNVKDL